jgi:uroporphyrinogen-III decarboxylase
MPQLKWTSHADLAIRRNPTVGREEYLDHMTFRRNDRPLFTEIFGPIVGLKEEWEQQGATPGELDFSAFAYRCESRAMVPVNTGRCGGRPIEEIEETDEHRIWRDELGRTMKLPKGVATLPLPLDYPVKTMDDWLAIKPLYEFGEERFTPGWQDTSREHLANDRVLCVAIPGGFDEPRQLMGDAGLCIAYYEQPELVRDILDTLGETARRVLDRVSSEVQVDMLCVHEDMAGKSGPLAGPAQVREFIAPYYRRVWDMLRERGARLFDQDSDGDMTPVIDAFLEAGVNCMHPMEPAANMDIVKVREQYGERLAFYGGLDKHVLRRSKADIVKELEYKIPPMVETGGCVLGLDHRIPGGTPLDHYRFYVEKVWEILERETGTEIPRRERRSTE